jgi:hypothetical protein
MKILGAFILMAAGAFAGDPGWQITKARQAMEDGKLDLAWSRLEQAEETALRQGAHSVWIAARCQRTELALLHEDMALADSLCPKLSLLGEQPIDSARIRLEIARVRLAQGNATQAGTEAWEAHKSAHAGDDDALEAVAWLALSRSEFLTGKSAEAKQSLSEARSLADDMGHLQAQVDLEDARQNQAHPADALRLVRRAKERFRQVRWPTGVARALEQEASILDAGNNPLAASQAWKELEELAKRLGLAKLSAKAAARLTATASR